MLALERQECEQVVVAGVTITVSEIHASHVQLLFDGPKEVPIVRKELTVADGKQLLADQKRQRTEREIVRLRSAIRQRNAHGLPTSQLEEHLRLAVGVLREMDSDHPIQARNEDLDELGRRTEVVEV